MSVSARDFSLSVISSMFLNDIFSSSFSMQSLVDTTQRSQYLILHTLDVDAVIAVGSICSQRSRLIKLDFPALASPDHTTNTFIRIVHKIEKKINNNNVLRIQRRRKNSKHSLPYKKGVFDALFKYAKQ